MNDDTIDDDDDDDDDNFFSDPVTGPVWPRG